QPPIHGRVKVSAKPQFGPLAEPELRQPRYRIVVEEASQLPFQAGCPGLGISARAAAEQAWLIRKYGANGLAEVRLERRIVLLMHVPDEACSRFRVQKVGGERLIGLPVVFAEVDSTDLSARGRIDEGNSAAICKRGLRNQVLP